MYLRYGVEGLTECVGDMIETVGVCVSFKNNPYQVAIIPSIM